MRGMKLVGDLDIEIRGPCVEWSRFVEFIWFWIAAGLCRILVLSFYSESLLLRTGFYRG